MSVITACDVCNHRRKIPDSKLGEEIKCSVCSAKFIAEEAPEVDEEERDPNEPVAAGPVLPATSHKPVITGPMLLKH